MIDASVIRKPKRPPFKHLLACVLLIMLLLVVLVASLTVLLSVHARANVTTTAHDALSTPHTCNSRGCISAANMILENMDESVDPCENFYLFSCGTYIKTKRLNDDQVKVDEFSILRDKVSYLLADLLAEQENEQDCEATHNAKKLYVSCMNESALEERGIADLLSIIEKDLGGWPVLQGGAYSTQRLSVLDRLIKLRKIEPSAQIFELVVGSNPKQPLRSVLRLGQPTWFFDSLFFGDKQLASAYKRMIMSVLTYLNAPLSRSNLLKEVNKLVEIERKFSLLLEQEDVRHSLLYENMTLGELSTQFPQFEWQKFVRGIFSSVDFEIDDDETILVNDVPYLIEASKLFVRLEREQKKDLENYLVWSFVKNTLLFLPKRFQDAKNDFDRVYDGTLQQQPRTLFCVTLVHQKMELPVGRIFVTRFFNKTSKTEAEHIISNVIWEFKKILNESHWMDDVSRQLALDKINHMDFKIGYGDELFNNSHLNQMYHGYTFKRDELLNNYCNMFKADSDFSLRMLRKEHDPNGWVTGPAVVNAFYSPPANQICFPAAVLQRPFYDLTNPKYLNYGAIGQMIGHELTHGFDDQGRLFDKNGVYHPDTENGNQTSLWSEQTIANFKERSRCMVNQYSSYFSKQVNQSVNGLITQSENIADNGGLKESLRAYRSWLARNAPEPPLPGLEKFTSEQMFFISYAQMWCNKARDQELIKILLTDSHAPGEFRIVGVTSNSEDFSKAFQCKSHQANNPANKCAVW